MQQRNQNVHTVEVNMRMGKLYNLLNFARILKEFMLNFLESIRVYPTYTTNKTFCKSNFSKSSSNACPKCQSNLKLYGKPSRCILCSISAAFKSDKCYRCVKLG